MGKSDQWVITAIVLLLILHTTVWIIGYRTNRLSYFFSLLNLASAAIIVGIWSVNEFRIQQLFIETREIVVLGFELLVAAVSMFIILSHPASNRFKIMEYLFFGIHLTILTAALVFMMTFKIKRLF